MSNETVAANRQLQITDFTNTIQCIQPQEILTWYVNKEHFPVYIRNSIFNSDPNYDYGDLTLLATTLTSTNYEKTEFYQSFSKTGSYVFGDIAAPDQYTTIVKVVSDEAVCDGYQSWPITPENMKKFGIASNKPQLKSYDPWLHMIPPFFILVAFCTIWCQRKIERRIEKRELAIRIEAEGKSQDMARYFKKKQDKFDRLEYLTDLYKLIKENLDEINDQIAENDRRTREEDHDNMEKMLKDKHSILRELRKGKGDTNLNDIKSGLMLMLSNLRFWDGRSLEEMYNEAMKQERLEAEEARLEEIDR